MKYVIYLIKKIFCILTIKENKICILPYKKLENKIAIKVITKIILKNSKSVVLSKHLNEVEELNVQLSSSNIYVYNGNILNHYMLSNIIHYISEMSDTKDYNQEVNILVNNPTKIDEENIIYFAKHFKRVNIVTKNINRFKKIEAYLEQELGIGITISNNKRKGLLKAKIIINIDFDEEMINSFNINSKAIIIQTNSTISIKSKLFNGINVLDYQIIYDNNEIRWYRI